MLVGQLLQLLCDGGVPLVEDVHVRLEDADVGAHLRTCVTDAMFLDSAVKTVASKIKLQKGCEGIAWRPAVPESLAILAG